MPHLSQIASVRRCPRRPVASTVAALGVAAALIVGGAPASASTKSPMPSSALAERQHTAAVSTARRGGRRVTHRRAVGRAADALYADGHRTGVGFACDTWLGTLSTQSYSTLPAGQAYFMAYVHDGAYRFLSKTGWIQAGTWAQLFRRLPGTPVIDAKIYVTYARWNGSGWSYISEWASDFSQDDLGYSHSCFF